MFDSFTDGQKKEWLEIQKLIKEIPEITSVLYDLNLLPEVLATFNQGPDSKEFFYMVTIVDHFKALRDRLTT